MNTCKLRSIVRGLKTYLFNSKGEKGTGGTDSARYCYSVWLRHLVKAKSNGLNTEPKVIAELGPGDSLGIGLAALLSGSEKYYAFDVVKHANTELNLVIFEELAELFKHRADIPDHNEFPSVKPELTNYRFPYEILSDQRLSFALNENRVDRIRRSLEDPSSSDGMIIYKVPWHSDHVIEHETVEVIYSQAVMEHVDDLTQAYENMYIWLKKAGYISHQIDFKCHGTAKEWNGHWLYSDFIWKLIRGKREYLLNRRPYSDHLKLIKDAGFTLIDQTISRAESNYTPAELAPQYRNMSLGDLQTCGAFVQALKF